MKKFIHIPRFLFLLPFFLGIALLLWNCEKEDFTVPLAIEKETSLYTSRKVSISEIPEVKSYLDEKLNTALFHRVAGENEILFNYESILEVTDTFQNTNYSFRFVFSDSPAGEFYNLVVGRAPTGELKEPLVFRYVCDEEQVDTFVLENYNINYFKGVITLHAYTDFFEQGSFSRTDEPCEPEYDDEGNIVGCAETTVNFSGSPGVGSGTGYNSNPMNTGGGSGCDWEIIITPCENGDSYQHYPEPYTSGEFCSGSGINLSVECAGEGQNRVGGNCGDCTEPLGAVGVNTEESVAIGILKKIKSTDLDPCSNEILNSLKQLQSNHIAEVIQRFGSPNSIYDWEIVSDIPSNPDNVAETDWRRDLDNTAIDYDYLTIINPSYVGQATNLAIARTILHESIHAYILSYTNDVINNNTNINVITNFQNNFSEVWDFYVAEQNGIEIGNIEDAHHEQIATTFIDTISNALAEYDNNQQNNSYYQSLAWGALFETDAWSLAQENGDISPAEAAAIINANYQEDTNGASANGLPCS